MRMRRAPQMPRLNLERLEERLAPASFSATTFNDTVAVNLATGQDASGNVSLRSAIMAANHLGGASTIHLDSGQYLLTLPGVGEDDSASGDLDIKTDITIE